MKALKEQEWHRLTENYNALHLLQASTSKALSSEVELTKREKARVGELENRLSDTVTNYDDSKKAYFKSKEERERLRQELDKFKSA